MRSIGIVLAIVGIIIGVVALVNHFVHNFLGSSSHMSVIVGAVGAVVLVIGVVLSMMSGTSSAKA